MKKNPLERAKEELLETETLIWADTPDINRRSQKKRKASIFGKLIILVVLLWMVGVIITSFSTGKIAGLALAFFGLPFLFLARKLVNKTKEAKIRATQTFYALTSNRLLIINDYKKKSVQSFDIHKLEFLERTEHTDGTGNILFAKKQITTVSSSNRKDAPSPKSVTHDVKIGFTDIREAKELEREIQKLIQLKEIIEN
ncbi:hypothetical protein [Kiloniella antarctica]|uniref:DUF304 domain-containing protein n=1 Tax=Kiloniella antarctica TaxID=1550907 RepID=A0ABW5BNC6_9PROT